MYITRREVIGSVAVGLATLAVGARYLRNKAGKQLAENQYIIPGTWAMDIDEIRFGCDKETYQERLKHTDYEVDYSKLRFNARHTHLFWEHETEHQRSLTPENGAEFAVLDKNYENVNLEDLTAAEYNRNGITADDDPSYPGTSLLREGTVIGIRTGKDYAKMRIDKYLTRRRDGVYNFVMGLSKIPLYDLLVTLEKVGPNN